MVVISVVMGTASYSLPRLRGREGRRRGLRMRVWLPPPGLPRERGRGAGAEDVIDAH